MFPPNPPPRLLGAGPIALPPSRCARGANIVLGRIQSSLRRLWEASHVVVAIRSRDCSTWNIMLLPLLKANGWPPFISLPSPVGFFSCGVPVRQGSSFTAASPGAVSQRCSWTHAAEPIPNFTHGASGPRERVERAILAGRDVRRGANIGPLAVKRLSLEKVPCPRRSAAHAVT